jgi:5-methylcytosine-specific restriction protein B
MFTWIPIFTELGKKILAYRNRQGELLAMLEELKAEKLPVISTEDEDRQQKPIQLAEIDPFTFYACFNRGLTLENRRRILAYLKTKFQLAAEVPTDFDGVPVVPHKAAWFFPWARTRKPDDIPSLWALAEAVVKNPPEKLEAKFFDRCLRIEAVGPAKLTMGMFWLNPKQYIACDANNRKLFEGKTIGTNIEDLSSYLRLIRGVNAKLGTNYAQISYDAWKESNEPPPEKQYWAGGFLWGETSKLDEFLQGNFWQFGWEKTETRPAAKKTWAYFDQVKVGDEFAIKGYGGRNDLRVYYIGNVIEKSDGDGKLKLQRLDRALYRGKGPSGLTGATWFDTLVPIKSKAIIDQIFHGEQPLKEPLEKEAFAMNLILYGPPGTGKTYQTIERAVKIIDPGFSGDHGACKQKFDELVQQGRIEFITFHQSYSYEDFVEGIRPVLDADEEADVPRYECRAGVFKRLAVNALFDCLEPAGTAKQRVPFDILWKALLARIESAPEANYPGLTEKTSYQLALTPRANIEGINVISRKKFLCSRKVLEEVFEAKRSQDTVTASEVTEVVARGCHSHLVAAVFNELKRIEKSQVHHTIQLQNQRVLTDEEKTRVVQRFLVDGEKSGYRLRLESQWAKYVLVIDEINRGNISKIFGELITLIEEDKRVGKGEQLIVTLPYSGERFGVPANLYLVGTMNTADKSIALVDVALRRRFDFEELGVNLSVCETLNDKMRSALQELNRRIVLRKDRDHQIGHAYFIDVSDEEGFNERFRSKIIPLLQEYFYNDWEGLRYVLGESPNSDGNFIRKVEAKDTDDRQARTKWQWFFDGGNDDLNCLQTLCENYKLG